MDGDARKAAKKRGKRVIEVWCDVERDGLWRVDEWDEDREFPGTPDPDGYHQLYYRGIVSRRVATIVAYWCASRLRVATCVVCEALHDARSAIPPARATLADRSWPLRVCRCRTRGRAGHSRVRRWAVRWH